MFTRSPLKSGLYESFFAKACHPAGGLAVWIRYTIQKRPGQKPNGSVWLTLFDATAAAPVATKETLPAGALSDEPYVRIGESSFAPGRIRGKTRQVVPPASWDLEFEPGEQPLRHLPERLYRTPLPKTKLESLHPSTRLNGTVVIGDRTVTLDGWPGVIGHNWGKEHAERWMWLQAAGFEGRRLDSWIDVAFGRLKIGPFTTPWIANGAISIDGRRQKLGGLGRVRQTKVVESTAESSFVLRGKDVSVEGQVSADPARFVGWLYADPGGSEHHVLNCSIADLTLRVQQATSPARSLELRLRGAATYEIGLRETDHGVPIQPYADGAPLIGGKVGIARARDGLELRTYRWPAVGTPRAHLLLLHGIAEHAGRYAHVASRLASAGIATHAYDQRGFGGSGGRRAYVERWPQYHDDVEDRLAELRAAAGGLPVVLYGHSMGGLIAIGYTTAVQPRPLPDLLVLSAPAIDAVVPGWKRRVAEILARTVPRFAIANTFPKGALSSEPAVEPAYLADPLAVHRTTARLGVALFREQHRVIGVLAGGGPLPVTTYVLHGADDQLVPEWASRSLEGRANVTRRVYQGLRHETHNEPSGAAVVDDTIEWIVRQVEKIATR